MKSRGFPVCLFVFMVTFNCWALQTPETGEVPAELKQWEQWVLHGKEEYLCPNCYNSMHNRFCVWPAQLELSVDERGGRFKQKMTVYKRSWILLPGTDVLWPENVVANKEALPVVEKGDRPCAILNPGKYFIEGVFSWDELPEMITVPAETGIVHLRVGGREVEHPFYGNNGEIWLHKKESLKKSEDFFEVKAYRIVQDLIPARIKTHLKLNVSGKAREIRLINVVVEGFTPMEIQSPIPTRIEADGELLIQARPGRWVIQILARSTEAIHKIGPVDTIGDQEVWAFQSQNHLRMVEIKGIQAIDPNQTNLPWKEFPSYIVNSGDEIVFHEIKRGNPDPAPDQLNLKRTWWLDFDGLGYTVQDIIGGTMSRQWYLAMNKPGLLGHAKVDGQDQLITNYNGKSGVELRKGHLNLIAESRYDESLERLKSVGWDHDFQSLEGYLNVPPGWKILAAKGVDRISGTWLDKWNLLNVFLVLIISLGIFKLWDWKWGLLALVTMILIYHEIGSPRIVWLHILAATALISVMPEGKFKGLVNSWQLISIVILIGLSFPFMVNQARWGVYPQLEPPGYVSWMNIMQTKGDSIAMHEDESYQMAEPQKVYKKQGRVLKSTLSRTRSLSGLSDQEPKYDQESFMMQDPNALIQTGPGLPKWKWRNYKLAWNGPVDRGQEVRLWYLSPGVNLFLAFLRVILLAVLIVRMIPVREWSDKMKRLNKMAGVSVVLCLGLFAGMPGNNAYCSSYPSPELLKELQKRLLEGPECHPYCAAIDSMRLDIMDDEIVIDCEVNAIADTAIPLPGSSSLWRPQAVTLNSIPSQILARDKDGLLWILVPEGVNNIRLKGHTPQVASFEVLLPLRPHNVGFKTQGWDVQGIDQDAKVQGSIKLVKRQIEKTDEQDNMVIQLPAFMELEREILLGLDWTVLNRIKRITPVGDPVVVSVPLLEGESITATDIRVEGDSAVISMGPEADEIRWISSLKKSDTILLKASVDVPFSEIWVLNASPIWHCDLSGIPLIHNKNEQGQWKPQWRPWPGEEVKISVSRPKALSGQTVTIDNADVAYTPGKRLDRVSLSMNIRSSKGIHHRIVIPEHADLDSVSIQGKDQPIRDKDGEIIVPLRPGSQNIGVQWNQQSETGLITRLPGLDIGSQSVNLNITYEMPKSRWILLAGGPRLGPAVLFWSYLIVVVIVSIGLGLFRITPLKSWQWFLLGMGLSQINPVMTIVIVGWFIALGLKKRQKITRQGWFVFDLEQIIYAVWTVAALIGLYTAVQGGLLGLPDMHISGNGSYNFMLHWTVDRIGSAVPQPWVLSLPMFVYRVLMLAWALWLAFSLLKWLKWGWECFVSNGLWRKIDLKRNKVDI